MKTAAPSKAPADKEIRMQSFIWFNLKMNVNPAPASAETRARNDLRRISRIIMTKINSLKKRFLFKEIKK